MRLRTWVLAAPLRTAAAVVREVSALQAISDGRFELGIGTGRPDAQAETARLGGRWGTAAERIAQVEAVVAAVREQVRPVPEVAVTAAGPKILAVAGRIADRIGLAVAPQATEADLVSVAVLARAGLAGERSNAGAVAEVRLTVQIFGVGDQLSGFVARLPGMDLAALRASGAVGLVSGDAAEMAAVLRERCDRLGIDEIVVPEELTEAFAWESGTRVANPLTSRAAPVVASKMMLLPVSGGTGRPKGLPWLGSFWGTS
jgi:alkanesulfonate monooxygenase SsuD/methylene tetrahydromethanopterin reductase-like flavin-dependent oxidoreductase (luciferase family)